MWHIFRAGVQRSMLDSRQLLSSRKIRGRLLVTGFCEPSTLENDANHLFVGKAT